MSTASKNPDKHTEKVRFELRRGPNDFIKDKRAYYAYVLSNGVCIGSAKMSSEVLIPVEVKTRTAKEAANFKIIIDTIEEDLKCFAGLLDESGENRGELEQEIENLWIIKKRGRPVSEEGLLVRTTILLSEEDKNKLKVLGGSSWIREQIRKAQLPDKTTSPDSNPKISENLKEEKEEQNASNE